MALYERAAAQGLRDAQRILGIRYVTGADGVAHEKIGIAWLRQAADQGDEFAKTLVGWYAGKWRSRAVEAVRICHQKSVAELDDGISATDTLAAAVQASCAAALEAWVHAHCPDASSQGLHQLRAGAYETERSDVAAMVVALRTARQRTR